MFCSFYLKVGLLLANAKLALDQVVALLDYRFTADLPPRHFNEVLLGRVEPNIQQSFGNVAIDPLVLDRVAGNYVSSELPELSCVLPHNRPLDLLD